MEWLTLGLGLVKEIFEFINTKVAREYLDRAVKLELELQRLEAMPYDQQDDGAIVRARNEFSVIAKAAQATMADYRQSRDKPA